MYYVHVFVHRYKTPDCKLLKLCQSYAFEIAYKQPKLVYYGKMYKRSIAKICSVQYCHAL